MIKRVFVIGGGVARENATFSGFLSDNLEYLKSQEIDIYGERIKKWKDNLQENLGDDFEVIKIDMPKTVGCDFQEWKIIFEKYSKYFQDSSVFVGHSLGVAFLLKIFSSSLLPQAPCFLVAGPMQSTKGELLGSFSFQVSQLQNLDNSKMHFYASENDTNVPYSDFLEFQKLLPQATFRSYENLGHFIDNSDFPDLEQDIKNLDK